MGPDFEAERILIFFAFAKLFMFFSINPCCRLQLKSTLFNSCCVLQRLSTISFLHENRCYSLQQQFWIPTVAFIAYSQSLLYPTALIKESVLWPAALIEDPCCMLQRRFWIHPCCQLRHGHEYVLVKGRFSEIFNFVFSSNISLQGTDSLPWIFTQTASNT
jgi:hypothetical protein